MIGTPAPGELADGFRLLTVRSMHLSANPCPALPKASVSKAERKPLLRRVVDNPRHADPATLSTVTLSSVPTAVDTERNIIPAE